MLFQNVYLTIKPLQQWHRMRSRHGRKSTRRTRSRGWKFLWRTSPLWWQLLTLGQRWGPRLSVQQVSREYSPHKKVRRKNIYCSSAAGAVTKLRGGCPRGWISSTVKSFLPDTYCYKLLEEKLTYRKAKYSCQKQRSILLEFDTRAEVIFFHKTLYNTLPLSSLMYKND